MIKSFKSKHAKAIFEGKRVNKWRFLHKQLERRLQALDATTAHSNPNCDNLI